MKNVLKTTRIYFLFILLETFVFSQASFLNRNTCLSEHTSSQIVCLFHNIKLSFPISNNNSSLRIYNTPKCLSNSLLKKQYINNSHTSNSPVYSPDDVEESIHKEQNYDLLNNIIFISITILICVCIAYLFRKAILKKKVPCWSKSWR